MYGMPGCRARRTFALRNGQCPRQGLSGASTCERPIHEAIAVAPGRADERGSRRVAIARATSIAVEASAADVPDNRPLSRPGAVAGWAGHPRPPRLSLPGTESCGTAIRVPTRQSLAAGDRNRGQLCNPEDLLHSRPRITCASRRQAGRQRLPFQGYRLPAPCECQDWCVKPEKAERSRCLAVP